MEVVIGVDGGGTKTAVVALDMQRKVVFSEKFGSTNQNSVGVDTARKTLTVRCAVPPAS
jgi:N-acetylglucosamine kinase-like BadF-type ATPase